MELAQTDTMEAGTVQATTNGSITVGGVTIATNVEYNFVTSNADYAYAISSAKSTDQNTDAQRSIVELGEQLYQGDLMKRIGEDDFGRPSSIWTYNNDEVGVYPDAATYTYTKAISEDDLYDTLGNAIMQGNNSYNQLPYIWDIYYNGEALDENTTPKFKLPERNVDDDYLETATGTLTEVFVDDENRHITLTMIDTFLAEVVRVSDDDNVSINYLGDNMANTSGRQSSITLAGTTLTEGDKVLVTLYQDNNQFSIGSIELAETVTGTVTAVKSVYDQNVYVGKYATMDGNNYNYVGNTFAEDLADTELNDPTLNAENTLYLDNYGNMIAFEATERAVNYLYVEDSHDWLGGVQALVTFGDDGREETITVTKLNSNDDPSTLANGVYAYVRQGGNYELTSLDKVNDGDIDNDGTPDGTDDNVWVELPVNGDYDYGTSVDDPNTVGTVENEVGTADSTHSGQTVSYTIKNGYNAIEATYSVSPSENVVSLNNSTIFVDVEGNVVYTGYSNVPTMTDITFYVVYNKQLNADVVFITDGADNSTSDSFFFILDGTPVAQKRDTDGTMLYTYSAMVNDQRTEIVMKGKNTDSSGALLAKYALYKIDTITPDNEITDATCLMTADADGIPNAGSNEFGLVYSANNNVATARTSNTIRVFNDSNIADCTNNSVTGYAGQSIYRYNDETVFVEIRMDENGDVENVSAANNASVINTTSDDRPGNNNVFVLAVDDDSSRTPMATLVYVVTPDDSQFAEYTVTYPTDVANTTTYTVEAEDSVITSLGRYDIVNGSLVEVTVVPATGYKATVMYGTTEITDPNGDNVYEIYVDGNKAINVTTDRINEADDVVVQIDESTKDVSVLWTGASAPTDMNAIANKIVDELFTLGYTPTQDSTKTLVDETSGTYTFNVRDGYIEVAFSWDSSTDLNQGFAGKVNGNNVTVATGTALSALTGAATGGTLYEVADDTGLSATATAIAGKKYIAPATSITGAGFDVNVATAYVKVTGADADDVAEVGQDYTVAESAFTDAKGTGAVYTINSVTKYVAYNGSIDGSEVGSSHDITLDQDYVKVTVEITNDPTDSFKVVTDEDSTGLTDTAGTTYVAVGSDVTISDETSSGSDDVHVAVTDGNSINEANASVTDSGSAKTVTAGEYDITVTIDNV